MAGSRFPQSLRSRGAWLLALLALIATATIASIPDRERIPANSLAEHATPPPQIFSGEATRPGTESVGMPATPGVQAPSAVDSAAWKEIIVRRGDTFTGLLARTGLESGEIISAILGNTDAKPLYQLRPGQKLRVRADADNRIVELSYAIDHADILRLRRDAGAFAVTRENRNFETRHAYVAGVIENNLFEDGQGAGLSDPLIMKLVEIFGWDIDFARDLRVGDRFSVIHEEKYWLGQKIADGPILAAEFLNQGRRFRVLAHRDGGGASAYYTPEGLSVRRPFLRTPIEFSRVSSGYTLKRFHPILKTWTAHRGVDYAAPTGTPVRATATGRVLALGADGGYGKRIIIRHGGAYSTLYGHLNGYAKGLRAGSHVQQGQIIGYVGSTGLSTGPHLHYELQVDGVHRDPLRFKFPSGQPIAADQRDKFRADTAPLLAQLERIGNSIQLAATR
jgi:murein DD-endopeptidase MepM/ murein hydrolase activator NlpD